MYKHMCMIHTGDTMDMDQLDNACDSAKTLKEFSLVG